MTGLSFLKNISATAFKGASYLVNNSGESNITIGLSSGLPALTGYFSNAWNPYISSFAILGKDYLLKGDLDRGKPNVYLANLCSAKTDVFEPFDQQQLIWTGFYQSVLGLNIENPQIEFNGKLYSYYTGAVSTNIFGGDTYICRYGYRTTAQSYAVTYFKTGFTNTPGGGNISYVSGDIPFNMFTGRTGSEPVLENGNLQQREAIVADVNNWVRGNVNPATTLYQFIVESDDNINFRHCGDVAAGVSPADSCLL